MRIAVSSSTFRRPLAAGDVTQLEWLERCARDLGIDGVLADVTDFPRTDDEYVAQLRKVAIDLGLVPFGIDAAGLLDDETTAQRRDAVLGLATRFGACVIRTTLPPPGDVPPATFAAVAGRANTLSRAAKAANVTLLVATAPGTLGDDATGVRRLVKDVDSAWLCALPNALLGESGTKERYPAFAAGADDDPVGVAARASRSWIILDVPPVERPWELTGGAIIALRHAEAERRVLAGR